MAKNKRFAKKVLRKGVLCALLGTGIFAGSLLAGCDSNNGVVQGPAGANFYYGATEPNVIDNPGRVGDFYVETIDGDVWQLTSSGWLHVTNIKGPAGDQGSQGEQGEQGSQGEQGEDGKSAYDIAVENGYKGTESEWLASLKGDPGKQGVQGIVGVGIDNVAVNPGFDADGNMYMDMVFTYTDKTISVDRVYVGKTIYVGQELKIEKALVEAPAGATIELKQDVILNQQLNVEREITIDLSGHKIYNTENIWNSAEDKKTWSLISVREGGDLIIEDSQSGGAVEAKLDDCFAIDVREGGKLTINGGKFIGNVDAVYVYEGEAFINGGEFDIKQQSTIQGKEYNFVLNCYDENYDEGLANITVYGGMFYNFNPAQAGYGNDFVAEGYTVIQNGQQFVVEEE